MSGRSLGERAFIGLQHLLPQRGLSRFMGSLAESRMGLLRRGLIRAFLAHYPVDLAEAAEPDPARYASFDAFFTRRLRPGARPPDPDPRAALSPADGLVSQAGRIEAGRLVQAKGIDYAVEALLGGEAALAAEFAGGAFATIYLAPPDYHRVHMPLAGTLRRARFIPGDLFSVNAATADGVPGLFTRNERLACIFDTTQGPLAVVLVGALIVGSMSLTGFGRVRASDRRAVHELPVHDPLVALDRGAELGAFHMGSTVIVLFGPGGPTLAAGVTTGRRLRVGERLAAPR